MLLEILWEAQLLAWDHGSCGGWRRGGRTPLLRCKRCTAIRWAAERARPARTEASGEDIVLQRARVVETLPKQTVEKPRARADGYRVNCMPQGGGVRPTRTGTLNAGSVTSRRVGKENIALWACARISRNWTRQIPGEGLPRRLGLSLPGFPDEHSPQRNDARQGAHFFDKRAAVENLIQEPNNDIGLTAHASGQWAMSVNHFQLSLIVYNLNC